MTKRYLVIHDSQLAKVFEEGANSKHIYSNIIMQACEVEIINLSYGGLRLTAPLYLDKHDYPGMLESLKSNLTRCPYAFPVDAVIFGLGYNDWANADENTFDTYLADMLSLVSHFKNVGLKLYLLSMFEQSETLEADTRQGKVIQDYRDRLWSAKGFSGTAIYLNGTDIMPYVETQHANPDDPHLNISGHAALAAQLRSEMQLLGEWPADYV